MVRCWWSGGFDHAGSRRISRKDSWKFQELWKYVGLPRDVVYVSCVRAKCPMCRTGMVLHNNILAVTVMENIDHQCEDCELYFSLEDLAQHKKECKHRQVKCPDLSCNDMVRLSDITDHVINGCVRKALKN